MRRLFDIEVWASEVFRTMGRRCDVKLLGHLSGELEILRIGSAHEVPEIPGLQSQLDDQ